MLRYRFRGERREAVGNFVGSLSREQTAALIAVIGTCILVAGFLAGRAIGNGNDAGRLDGRIPTGISTRQGTLAVPTLGKAKPIPKLVVPQQQQSAEPATEEGTTPTYTPSSPAEAESPAPAPAPAPEVTVAPNG